MAQIVPELARRLAVTFDTQSRPKLAAIAAACLLTVALPSSAVLAKEKVKTPETATTAPPAPPEVSVTIPSVDAVASNVDDATLRAIFSGDIVGNADALASLTADSITIPTITLNFSTTVEGKRQTGAVNFKDIVLDDVTDGAAATVTMGGMELTTDEDVSGSFGKVSATDLDIGNLLGIYGLVDAGDQTELSTI
jgi:hypothetical protein